MSEAGCVLKNIQFQSPRASTGWHSDTYIRLDQGTNHGSGGAWQFIIPATPRTGLGPGYLIEQGPSQSLGWFSAKRADDVKHMPLLAPWQAWKALLIERDILPLCAQLGQNPSRPSF